MTDDLFDLEELDYGDLGDIDTSDFDLEQFERELGLLCDEPSTSETATQDNAIGEISDTKDSKSETNDAKEVVQETAPQSSDMGNSKLNRDRSSTSEAANQKLDTESSVSKEPAVQEAKGPIGAVDALNTDKTVTVEGKDQEKSLQVSKAAGRKEATVGRDEKRKTQVADESSKTDKAGYNANGKHPGYRRARGYHHPHMNPYMAGSNMAIPGYLPFYPYAMPQMMAYQPQTGSQFYFNPNFAQSSQSGNQESSAPPAGLSPEVLRVRQQILEARQRREASKAQNEKHSASKASGSHTSSKTCITGQKRDSRDNADKIRSNKRPNTVSTDSGSSAPSTTPYQGIIIKGRAAANEESSKNNSNNNHVVDGLPPRSNTFPRDHQNRNDDNPRMKSGITIRGRASSNNVYSTANSILNRVSSSSHSNASSPYPPNRHDKHDNIRAAGSLGMIIKGLAAATRADRIPSSPCPNASSASIQKRSNSAEVAGSAGITIKGRANSKDSSTKNIRISSRLLSSTSRFNNSSPIVSNRRNTGTAANSDTSRKSGQDKGRQVYNLLTVNRGTKRISEAFEQSCASRKRPNTRSNQPNSISCISPNLPK